MKMDLFSRGNDALKVNPINGMDEALTVHGSDWLWAATAIFSLALVRLNKLAVPNFVVLEFPEVPADMFFGRLVAFVCLSQQRKANESFITCSPSPLWSVPLHTLLKPPIWDGVL